MVPKARAPRAADGYGRDAFTWAAFFGLLGFGFLNATLGPALPYIRSVEHISYLVGAMHQVAFAVGVGMAGLLAARAERHFGRPLAIRLGLAGAGAAALGLAYGDVVAVTVLAALVTSFCSTTALVRIWAALADWYGSRRAAAMTEGEVSVSLGGILTPLLVAGVAGTVLTWRFAFVIGGVLVAAAVLTLSAVRIPPAEVRPRAAANRTRSWRTQPTLVVVFAIVALEFSLSFWLASYLNDSMGVRRGLAVVMVGGLYAANLAGRLLASRLARRLSAERLLVVSLAVALAGLPILLLARDAGSAAVGIFVTGTGIGALFPLTSSMHVASSPDNADAAIGKVLLVASLGQVLGPLIVGGIAQASGLRAGLTILPGLVLLAAAALTRYHRQTA